MRALVWCRLLWEKGAELRDSSSLYSLGVIHLGEGDLVERNVTHAQALLEEALTGQQWKAAWLLSQLHMEGDVPTGKNCTSALEYMWAFIQKSGDVSSISQDAFEQLWGHPLTSEDSIDVTPNPFQALLLYAYLAEKGSVFAGMNAGWMLERGQGLPFVPMPELQVETGRVMMQAHGVHEFSPTGESLRLAAYYYGLAAFTNHTSAMVDYGNLLMHLQGPLHTYGRVVIHTSEGVRMTDAQQMQKSLELYANAKARGDAEAATNLAWAHFAGVGVRQDLQRAQELYLEAAEMASDSTAGFAPLAALLLTRGLQWGLPSRAGARFARWVGIRMSGWQACGLVQSISGALPM